MAAFNTNSPLLVNMIAFHKNLIAFLDELIGQFPEEGDLVIIRIFLKDKVPVADIMNQSCYKILPLKTRIKERDDAVFLDNDVLFSGLKKKDKVNHFKRLWRSGRLDQEDKDAVWRWMDVFVHLMEKHEKIYSQINGSLQD